MRRLSAREIGEIVAVISVVLSLVFVGLQLRQSTAATQAAAYQELGIATSDMLFDLSSRSELLAAMALSGRDIESLESLSSADLVALRVFTQGILRLYETAYLQVEIGILAPDSLDYLGWENYRNSSSLKNLWPSLRQSLNPVKCKGPVRIVACIEDPVVIEKILNHLQAKEANEASPITRLPPPRAPPVLPMWEQGLAD